jgi:hypothetical protein
MPIDRPFIDWSVEMLQQGLAVRWRIIADIEELLRDPSIADDQHTVNNFHETSRMAALSATQIEQELQRRPK